MSDSGTSLNISTKIVHPHTTSKHWTSAAGAWLGIGTAPGALLVGAGIASRYGGAIPILSIVISFTLMFTLFRILEPGSVRWTTIARPSVLTRGFTHLAPRDPNVKQVDVMEMVADSVDSAKSASHQR